MEPYEGWNEAVLERIERDREVPPAAPERPAVEDGDDEDGFWGECEGATDDRL